MNQNYIPQSQITLCPECGGQRVQVEATANTTSGAVNLLLTRIDRAFKWGNLFSADRYSNLITLTCVHCGLTNFYATEPMNLIPKE